MPDFEATAHAICALGLGTRCPCTLDRFPDGTPNVHLPASEIEGRDVMFIGSPEPSRYLDFFSVVYSVPRYMARSFLVILPYYPTGTMERVDREGDVATGSTLARMMSAAPAPQVGQTVFTIFDIHALATRFFFGDSIKVLLPSIIPDASFDTIYGPDVVICFPDDGAKKRFGKIFEARGHRRMACCLKTRGAGSQRHVVLHEGDVRGCNVIIVDDLVQSGSTLAVCRDVLYRSGATQVAAFVVHAVFPRGQWKRFLTDDGGIEVASNGRGFSKFFVTDSIPWVTRSLMGKPPFEIIPISNSLARLLTSGNTAVQRKETAIAHL